ncbi:MAG: metallophosphoesterase [Pseudomonadota bacterium]
MGFYLTIFLIYGLMHFTVFRQFSALCGWSGWMLNLSRLFFAVMTFSPLWSRWLGWRTGLVAGGVFFWMGLMFYLFLGSLLVIPVKIFLGRAWFRPVFLLVAIGSVGLCLWGLQRARVPLVKEVVIISEKVTRREELKIALISDVHLESVEGESRLNRVLAVLETIDYDLLLSAGDLIEAGLEETRWSDLSEPLARLKPRLGKYAVMGNHETYANRFAGRDIAREFHQAAGFVLLNDESRTVGPFLELAGVPDDGRLNSPEKSREDGLLAGCDPGKFILFLKHRPTLPRKNAALFDLMVSGHTHNGQMWPFKYVVQGFFSHMAGYYPLETGNALYVSQGTGTWGPPLRVGAPPEITLFRIKGKD